MLSAKESSVDAAILDGFISARRHFTLKGSHKMAPKAFLSGQQVLT